MRTIFKKIHLLFFVVVISFCASNINPTPTNASTTSPSVDFSVRPSANEYIKPTDGNAEGRLDISLLPKGKATNEQRKPIDVFFVHDTSGSMKETLEGERKDTSAKNALNKAIDFFSQNAQSKDGFYFIPFDSKISNKCQSNYWYCTSKTIKETTGLNNIKNMISDLDKVSGGGTNYIQPLESVVSTSIMKNAETGSGDRKKYVIFLTDGEPTSLIYNSNLYEISTADTCIKNGNSNRCTEINGVNGLKKLIKSAVLDTSDNIGKNDITMYSIAFAKEGDVNYQLLDTMSGKTGGFATQSNSNSLTELFTNISSQFDSPSIDGDVTIDLKPFKGTVKVKDGANAYVDENNVAHVKFNFSYPINANPSPNEINTSLPLEFTKTGVYSFETIKINYKDLNGKVVQNIHSPVTITIKDDTAPTFTSSVDLIGNALYSPDSLVKIGTSDSESNQFSAKYTITPSGLVNSFANGSLTGLKIIQPLPDGITLANSQLTITSGQDFMSNASVKEIITEDNKHKIQIDIPKPISYSKGNFNVKEFSFSIKLKAMWALSYTSYPIATIQYNDSRFGSQSVTTSTLSKKIGMKVRLDTDNTDKYYYVGDAVGKIQKINKNSEEVVAETDLTANSLPNKPVMGLELQNNGKKIEITYYDNSKAYLYLKTNFEMKENGTGKILINGSSTAGPVQFYVTDFVLGKDVKYEYQLESKKGTTDWLVFDPKQPVQIPGNYSGEVKINVRTLGGFSSDSNAVTKSVVITKNIQSITVTPNPIEVDVLKSVDFTIKIEPEDALNKQLQISIENPEGLTVAELVDGDNNRILGVHEGSAKLVIKSLDGSNIRVEIPINVINPYVALKELHFTKAKYTITPGSMISIYPKLIFNPENATNKKIKNIFSTDEDIVEVVQGADGAWYVKANKIGYSTITVISDDNPAIKDTAVFEVHDSTDDNGTGNDNQSIDGKW
ncbi:VWA domain-containing protein [Heyndrickxia vini]|uniref:VWA domain-containing protein n=1 Tax=Heyndrickxia vini TaxID=1476025 RepID=A0ABX7E5X8_9BACI|nr:vWA domain-containing protein [Heyndrickxia vini]QQZ10699.1 VWA domain-containing protein [Heyndrickxia vini]